MEKIPLLSYYDKTMYNIGGSKTANAARVMALMSLGAKPGDVLHITVEGANEESVTTAMQELLNNEKL